jgi:hypothetical protein
MLSSHSQVEQPLVNFLELAKRRFPSAIVNGNCRYAVCSSCAGKPQTVTADVNRVILVSDKALAEELKKKPCGRPFCERIHELHDLQPSPVCRSIPDAYDPEEARRERREKRTA